MQAEIITIGDEILIGQIVDSNSAFLAKSLNKIGIEVSQITSVSDQIRNRRLSVRWKLLKNVFHLCCLQGV